MGTMGTKNQNINRLGIWEKFMAMGGKRGNGINITHKSCDDCDTELLLLLFTTQGKEHGKGRESGLGTEGLGNRNGGDGWDETELELPPCRPTVLLTRPVGGKGNLAQAGRERERDRDCFPFSLCSCARCFFLVYMIVFLFKDPLEWNLFGEKLGRSIHVLALCHSGLKLSFLLRRIWS